MMPRTHYLGPPQSFRRTCARFAEQELKAQGPGHVKGGQWGSVLGTPRLQVSAYLYHGSLVIRIPFTLFSIPLNLKRKMEIQFEAGWAPPDPFPSNKECSG